MDSSASLLVPIQWCGMWYAQDSKSNQKSLIRSLSYLQCQHNVTCLSKTLSQPQSFLSPPPHWLFHHRSGSHKYHKNLRAQKKEIIYRI
jgi:hypothetical protein